MMLNPHLASFIDHLLVTHTDWSRDDFQITMTQIGFVSGNKPDPFNFIYFYDKKEDNKSFTLAKSHISGLLNNNIQETHTHLICKKRSIYKLVLEEYHKFENN